ncbi:flagellar biosynthesis protein FlgL [Roseovarius sp. A21]|uniref:Flagellar biosynthesis protein FlgL n=1 Tax=Roseovarius bejariae TaxID=2576383 RepID=A0A844CLF0_9RHOB|nr:flagellin [Roseovarius bejariae]MRU15472.1 flagellar biosynthesis protein FlgL [Roseovarius bejariae]
MSLQTIGDLARGVMLRRQNAELKTQMARLTQEVSTGRTADPVRHLSAQMAGLADIEQSLTLNQSYKTAAAEAGVMASAMQAALGRVEAETGDLANGLVLAKTTAGPVEAPIMAGQARAALDAVVSSLSTRAAGRALFAGSEVSVQPLAQAGTLVSAVQTALGGASDAASVEAAVAGFFAPGGDFENLIYQGGDAPLGAIPLGAGEAVTLDIRADSAALRDVLQNTVLAVMAGDQGLGLTATDRQALLARAGEGLLSAQGKMAVLRADLDHAEHRIEQASSRIASEISGLEVARNTLTAIDPFTSASELEAVQLQLETLYTITARSSRLNLVNFLS